TDEKSIIGRRLLAAIDQHLLFHGGCSVLFFGDFGQLLPVLDLRMYAIDA
ncbi:11857_t:CDS:1, partial [Gigaspora rosea]